MLIVVIIANDVGATVPINFDHANKSARLFLSHGQLITSWHSQEMVVHSFTIEKLDLNSPFKDIMEDN